MSSAEPAAGLPGQPYALHETAVPLPHKGKGEVHGQMKEGKKKTEKGEERIKKHTHNHSVRHKIRHTKSKKRVKGNETDLSNYCWTNVMTVKYWHFNNVLSEFHSVMIAAGKMKIQTFSKFPGNAQLGSTEFVSVAGINLN